MHHLLFIIDNHIEVPLAIHLNVFKILVQLLLLLITPVHIKINAKVDGDVDQVCHHHGLHDVSQGLLDVNIQEQPISPPDDLLEMPGYPSIVIQHKDDGAGEPQANHQPEEHLIKCVRPKGQTCAKYQC